MTVLESLPERWKRDAGVGGLGVVLGMVVAMLFWSSEIGRGLAASDDASSPRDAGASFRNEE